MRIARIARPCAIYGASADAQTPPEGELFDVSDHKEDISKMEKMGIFEKKGTRILGARRAFLSLRNGSNRMILIKRIS